ncbi:MAG: hypothetical protein IT370_20070 [Deltaproteobacteria bacterium]|nr:hypothetical protein [Deltaproteobacteria bacterium]
MMTNRAAAVLVVLAFCAGTARADERSKIEKELLAEVARAKLKPFAKSKLKDFYPRMSMAAGGVEKIVNKVIETNGTSLGFMLTESAQPSGVTGNPYVDVTKGIGKGKQSPESQLARAIMSAKGQPTPGQVLGAALKITGGDYWLATLVCHNLLKEVTYAERSKQQALLGWDPKAPGDARRWILLEPSKLTAKLPNLRPAGDPQASDKMGPWYHMYGLFFVGGMTSGSEAETLAWVENLTRALGLGSSGDAFKEGMNTWAADLSYAMNGLVGKDLRVPTTTEAGALSRAELETKIKQLTAEHRKLQGELVKLSGLVNDPNLGPPAEQRMTAIRREQKTIYDEVMRLKQVLAKKP